MIELVALGLGSNLGRRFSNIGNAVRLISQSPNFNLLGSSLLYETEPWGFARQNDFLNCALAGFYRTDHKTLIREIKNIEKKMGRKKTKKWHPRLIDIDILFFGEKKIKQKGLVIPHPEIQNRNFVLKPLAELMPAFIHPVLRRSMADLNASSGDSCRVSLYRESII